MTKSYYDILGVSKSASDKELRQAYRRLARKYHPDVNPGDTGAGFKEINEAYEVLSNPDNRAKYDRFGDKWKYADQFAKADHGRSTFVDFADLGSSPFDLDSDSIFGQFFGGGFSRTRRTRSVLQYPVEITMEEAFTGASRVIQTQTQERCATCGGLGQVNNSVCPACGGLGLVQRPHRLEVKIPPGVDNGSKVRISGPDRQEILLLVSVKSHPGFQRRNNDLYAEHPIPLYVAILGGEVEVPTLKGRIALKITPETQNGRVFRLSGQGMPYLNSPGRRGDLFVTAKVVLPQNLSKEEKEKFQELKAIRADGRVG